MEIQMRMVKMTRQVDLVDNVTYVSEQQREKKHQLMTRKRRDTEKLWWALGLTLALPYLGTTGNCIVS